MEYHSIPLSRTCFALTKGNSIVSDIKCAYCSTSSLDRLKWLSCCSCICTAQFSPFCNLIPAIHWDLLSFWPILYIFFPMADPGQTMPQYYYLTTEREGTIDTAAVYYLTLYKSHEKSQNKVTKLSQENRP